MTDQKRPYRMRRRAELEQETRRRITEAAVALHGTVGPARTSVSAVAREAGVRRSTVYRHFPDEAALFEACSTHWQAQNPVPDPAAWAAIADPDERLAHALEGLFAYYRRTRPMIENLLRDESTVPSVAVRFGAFRAYLAAATDVLLAGRRPAREVAAAVGHAVAFGTWRSLAVEQGLTDAAAAGLLRRLVAVAEDAGSDPERRP